MAPIPSPPPAARRHLVMEELGRQLAAISEKASCTRWPSGLEDALPPVLQGAVKAGTPCTFKTAEISPVLAEWLVALATELGHWVKPGDAGHFVPHFPECLRDPDSSR